MGKWGGIAEGQTQLSVKGQGDEKNKICSVKLGWGEVGRNQVIKSFVDHTKEFGPYVEGSREHILKIGS